MAATAKDPGAPLPEGSAMTPAVGAQLVIPAGLPRNLEAAIQRYVFAFSFDFSPKKFRIYLITLTKIIIPLSYVDLLFN